MRKIFLDTNVLLDYVLRRPGSHHVDAIIELASGNKWMHLYVSYLSMANTAYIIRKRLPEDIRECLAELSGWVDILPMNDMQFMTAVRDCKSPDFEDALQIMCAEEKECDLILTNNATHFKSYTEIPVMTPSEFLSHLDHTA